MENCLQCGRYDMGLDMPPHSTRQSWEEMTQSLGRWKQVPRKRKPHAWESTSEDATITSSQTCFYSGVLFTPTREKRHRMSTFQSMNFRLYIFLSLWLSWLFRLEKKKKTKHFKGSGFQLLIMINQMLRYPTILVPWNAPPLRNSLPLRVVGPCDLFQNIGNIWNFTPL